MRVCNEALFLFLFLLVVSSNGSEEHPALCCGAGRPRRRGVQQRGDCEWEGGAGAAQAAGHQSSEGAGQRGRYCTLAGAQRCRGERRLQRLHVQDLVLQEETASDPRCVAAGASFLGVDCSHCVHEVGDLLLRESFLFVHGRESTSRGRFYLPCR